MRWLTTSKANDFLLTIWPKRELQSSLHEENSMLFLEIDWRSQFIIIWVQLLDSVQEHSMMIKPPKYLNTTETALYNKSKILYWLDKAKQRLNEFWALIVVEWYMDVIALHQYGLPVWIATCWTALTTEHAKLLRRHSDTLYFAFDWDKAWFEASIRGLKVCYKEELYPRIITIPEWFKDIDEYLTWAWEQVTIEAIRSMSTDWLPYVLNMLLTQFDPKNPVERKKIQEKMFELLNSIEWLFNFDDVPRTSCSSTVYHTRDIAQTVQNIPWVKKDKNSLQARRWRNHYNLIRPRATSYLMTVV